jgi:hypothetical protein
MSQEVSLHHTERDLDNVVGVAGIREEMIVVQKTVAVGSTEFGIEHRAVQRKVAVEEKAVGKLP